MKNLPLKGGEGELLVPEAMLALAVKSNLAVLPGLEEQLERREDVGLAHLKLGEGVQPLLTVRGSGQILGMPLRWATGERGRVATGGDFAS